MAILCSGFKSLKICCKETESLKVENPLSTIVSFQKKSHHHFKHRQMVKWRTVEWEVLGSAPGGDDSSN